MGVRGNERVRGVLLRRIDTERIVAEANEELPRMLALQGKEFLPGMRLKTSFEPWGYRAHGDKQYVVCSEGVGYEVTETEDEPWQVPLYMSRPNADGTGHLLGITPSWTQQLTGREVRQYLLDEQIDLADLIRQFGARLEQNFWIWFRELGGLALVQAGPQ
jgi:hypothetical protein